jgi:DnaJ-class molecular chaperone
MSKTKQILELESPSMKTKLERLTGLVQKCNYCCGNGWFWGTDEFGDGIKQPCPMCEGTGQLRPEITIEWKPIL